jgi:hypothetical protein
MIRGKSPTSSSTGARCILIEGSQGYFVVITLLKSLDHMTVLDDDFTDSLSCISFGYQDNFQKACERYDAAKSTLASLGENE